MADDVTYSGESIDRLLTCPVCLDRYNQPKILPCQHTFCMSPCLEGLVDMRTRKIRCPECRVEHFVPYSGAGGFPNNRTISNFLDLPTQTASPRVVEQAELNETLDDNVEASTGTSRKCGVCETETDTTRCLHCDKLTCNSCRQSHIGQMKLDVGRLVNQIRRGIPKISGNIATVEQKSEQIKQHVEGIKSEVKDTVERYIKELRDRDKMLNSELETFLQGEQRSLRLHQENLEVELASMASYCDSTEGLLNRAEADISDGELVSIKQQCVEYMEQIRREENESIPETKHVRFSYDGQPVHSSIVNFGELLVSTPSTGPGNSDQGRHDAARQSSHQSSQLNQTGNRRRWSSSQPLDSLYFATQNTSPRAPPQPSPRIPPQSPPQVPFYRSASPEQEGNLRRNRGVSRSSTLPSRANDFRTSYMFPLGTPRDDDILEEMARLERSMELNPLTSPRNSDMASLFASRSRLRNSNEERFGGLMGGGSSVSAPISRPPIVRRPGDAFVIDIGQNNSRGRSNRGRGGRSPTRNRRVNRSNQATTQNSRNLPNSQGTTQSAATSVSQADADAGSPLNNANQSDSSRNQNVIDRGPPPPQGLRNRSGTFVRDDGPSASNASLPVVSSQGVRYDLPVDVSIGDLVNVSNDANSSNNASSTVNVSDSLNVSRSANGYENKGTMSFQIGSERGNNTGQLTWPRGIAVSPLNGCTMVADSSNHRVQMFDSSGQFVSTFGSYGTQDGEFDCLAGLAINHTTNDIVIADRYNHRVQVFDQHGTFKLKFGQEGSGDGQLNYPWGIAVDTHGYIYVCDKENHRVQVFQSEGAFVRQFGQLGNGRGDLENPHYIAVGVNDDKIYVSDTSNHRIQILNKRGHHIKSFGTEGSGNGQLKYPKGIAVDRQGFVIVADSGNNRVQVFRGDGRYFAKFGEWGVGNGQFKGLEGVAVSPSGQILVCDKENHRIQVF